MEKMMKPSEDTLGELDSVGIKTLIDTALGKTKADMVIANADLVNVYSGELLRGWSVAIKGDRIAYAGENAEHTVGPDTRVIDATGKVLAPGFIDSHAHLAILCRVDEFLRYAMRGGTTTIISESLELVPPLGYSGVRQFLEAISNQPVKIFATVAPVLSFSPGAKSDFLNPAKLPGLLKQKRVVGMGETPWQFILQDNDDLLRFYAEALNLGKSLVGHGAGARGNKLAAYVAAGITSCHESTTADEALERLRLGLHVMIREGGIRKELEAISRLKDKPIDFRRLVLCTDSIFPKHLMEHGYIEAIVQKAVDLGFDPIVAIQMATLNAAEHYSLDNFIGGIAPGKYADMVVLPNLQTMRAETVISNGKVIAQNGQIVVSPKKYQYPRATMRSVHIPRKLKPADFQVRVQDKDEPVIIRVINLFTPLVTREEHVIMTPENGLLEADTDRDILKVAYIDRKMTPGKMFTGFVKGFGLRTGAYATSATRGLSGIIVVGSGDKDIADAVNRIIALQGGAVVCAGNEILAELPMPIGGYVAELPLEEISRRRDQIQQTVTGLGVSLPDAQLTLVGLTTNVIPFFRICESGLLDIGKGELKDLIV